MTHPADIPHAYNQTQTTATKQRWLLTEAHKPYHSFATNRKILRRCRSFWVHFNITKAANRPQSTLCNRKSKKPTNTDIKCKSEKKPHTIDSQLPAQMRGELVRESQLLGAACCAHQNQNTANKRQPAATMDEQNTRLSSDYLRPQSAQYIVVVEVEYCRIDRTE